MSLCSLRLPVIKPKLQKAVRQEFIEKKLPVDLSAELISGAGIAGDFFGFCLFATHEFSIITFIILEY